ncbi:MAG TPA: hypothetical protein VFG71_10715 [Nitrospiraceae bacterium]|nr:hypothetical protein [Nitrospiraceae bacterium]
MRLHWLSFLFAGFLCVGACATGPQIDENIATDAARGSVYLARIPDPRFQAAHPIKLDRNLIARTLRGVLIREQQDVLHTLVVGRSNISPVFSEEDIDFLSPLIEQALTRAAPDQQVGFRVLQSGTADYSERTGAAVGSSEPPLSLSPREFTSGVVYAYGRSLYLALSEYRHRPDRPDTVNMPNRRLPDQTGLVRRDVLFTPDVALRSDLAPPKFSSDGFAKTLVIDLQRLAQAPASTDAALPTKAPSQQPPPPSGDADTGDAGEASAFRENELESIKADMKKKDSELEELRKELGAIKRQLDQQAEQNGKPAAPQKKPFK